MEYLAELNKYIELVNESVESCESDHQFYINCGHSTKALVEAISGLMGNTDVIDRMWVEDTTPIAVRDSLFGWINSMREDDVKKKHVYVINSTTGTLALSVLLANTILEKKLKGVPYFDSIDDVKVFEVHEEEVVNIQDSEGYLRTNSLDEANRPLVLEWMKLQQMNSVTGESEIVDVVDDSERKTLEEVIEERKSLKEKPVKSGDYVWLTDCDELREYLDYVYPGTPDGDVKMICSSEQEVGQVYISPEGVEMVTLSLPDEYPLHYPSRLVKVLSLD